MHQTTSASCALPRDSCTTARDTRHQKPTPAHHAPWIVNQPTRHPAHAPLYTKSYTHGVMHHASMYHRANYRGATAPCLACSILRGYKVPGTNGPGTMHQTTWIKGRMRPRPCIVNRERCTRYLIQHGTIGIGFWAGRGWGPFLRDSNAWGGRPEPCVIFFRQVYGGSAYFFHKLFILTSVWKFGIPYNMKRQPERQWRKIPWSSKYELSSDGCLRWTNKTEKIKYPSPFKKGRYPAYSIHGRNIRVHHLVMIIWGPPKPDGDGYIIRHLDDNPNNNDISNLAWGTHEDNFVDWISNNFTEWVAGTLFKGQKIKVKEALEIMALLDDGVSLGEIASKYGVSRASVADIKKGRTHRYTRSILYMK